MSDMIRMLEQTECIYIFGAQSRATTLMGYIKELFPKLRIKGFLTDDSAKNEEQIGTIPVFDLSGRTALTADIPVLIATKGIFHDRIRAHLLELGFTRIYPITAETDNLLRNAYVRKIYEENGRAFVKLDELPRMETSKEAAGSVTDKTVRVYVAKSVFDKELETAYVYPAHETPIQVGAALTTKRIAELTDDTGDHISERNRQYSELTGLYWMWKNCHYDFAGLAHYRRHFILPPDWIERMLYYEIDAIVPVPTYVYPNIDLNYRERHISEDWDFLLDYLRRTDKRVYEKALEVFGGNLYFPCNMLIAKWNVLDALCTWMFPILDAVTKNGGTKSDSYENRYAGFVSEYLITLFFALNEEKYKLVYADRMFLK